MANGESRSYMIKGGVPLSDLTMTKLTDTSEDGPESAGLYISYLVGDVLDSGDRRLVISNPQASTDDFVNNGAVHLVPLP